MIRAGSDNGTMPLAIYGILEPFACLLTHLTLRNDSEEGIHC